MLVKRISVFFAFVLSFAAAIAQTAPPVSLGGSAGITGGQSLLGMTSITVSGNYTLAPNEWWAGTLIINGSPGSAFNVVAPLNNGQQYKVLNLTSQTGTIIGSTGTGVPVQPYSTSLGGVVVFSNGVNYYSAGSIAPDASCTSGLAYYISGAKQCTVASVRTYLKSGQLDIEGTAIGTAYSIFNLGDSNCAGAGATTAANGWCARLAQRLGLATSSNLAPNNLAVAGDTAQDESFRFYNSTLNPGNTANPILVSATVTNNIANGSGGIVPFQQTKFGTYIGATISSSDKVLAGNAAVTPAGTWAAYTTFANTPGLSTSTAGSFLTYTAYVGLSGAFYVPYANLKAGPNGVFKVTIDGADATDTISNSVNVNTNWSVLSNNTTAAVGAARYVTTPGSHTLSIVYVSGTIRQFGFFFPPTLHYRGANSPRIFAASAIPQQNDANAATVKLYNAALLSVVQTLVADGLQVQYVDLYNGGIDPVRDMSSTTIQGCVASTNPGLHLNDCGHDKTAGIAESAIGAAFNAPNSNLIAPLNTIGIPTVTNLATQANGLDTNSYSPGGTAFPKGSWCVDSFAGFCWGLTMLGSGGGPFRTILTSNGPSSGRISFAFLSAGALPSATVSGISSEWAADGSATLAPNITVTSTAAGNTLSGKLVNFNSGGLASTISGYHNISGNGTTTTGLNQGINLWGTASNAGIHVLQNTTTGVFSVGVYAPSTQNICHYFYTNGTTPSSASNFTCPDWVSSDGTHHFTGLTFGTSTNIVTAAPGTGTDLRRSSGTFINGNLVKTDSNGNFVDAGTTGGTINNGTANQISMYTSTTSVGPTLGASESAGAFRLNENFVSNGDVTGYDFIATGAGFLDASLTTSTYPICPNGSSGRFNVVGCRFGPGAGATVAGAGGATATCADATGTTNTYCGSAKGNIQIVGGTATTGTVATVTWSESGTPRVCMVTPNGQGGTSTAFFDIGHTVPTSTGFSITAGISILGQTLNLDYICQ